jgi:ribose transport system permease protein
MPECCRAILPHRPVRAPLLDDLDCLELQAFSIGVDGADVARSRRADVQMMSSRNREANQLLVKKDRHAEGDVRAHARRLTFLTWSNLSTVLGSQAVLLVVTLGLIIPLTANDFDLSIAFVMTMSSMLVAVLNVNDEIGVGWAVIAALALGIAVDLINGLLITIFRIHSLIVTLGTGTFLHGATLWLSDSMTISGISPSLMNAVMVDRSSASRSSFTTRSPSPLLSGTCSNIQRSTGAFFLSAVDAKWRASAASTPIAFASLALPLRDSSALGLASSRRDSGRGGPGIGRLLSAAGPRRRLPWIDRHRARTVQPGGATVAVYFLSLGITGLVFLGFSSFIQEMFYGGALVIAITLSQLVRGRQEQQFWPAIAYLEPNVDPLSLERDFGGYGGNPPDARWPSGARIALNFVLNYEEGSEYSIMDKDGVSDTALTELPSAAVPRGDRDLVAESMFEYGSRVGFWRLDRLF